MRIHWRFFETQRNHKKHSHVNCLTVSVLLPCPNEYANFRDQHNNLCKGQENKLVQLSKGVT